RRRRHRSLDRHRVSPFAPAVAPSSRPFAGAQRTRGCIARGLETRCGCTAAHAVDPTCAFEGVDSIDARGLMNEKILHLRSVGGLYGAEQVILNLARELNALGCTNHVVCFNNAQNPHLELVEQATKADLSAFAIDCRWIFDHRTINSIREIIRSKDIDIIHGHDYKTRFFGLCAANGLKLKKIATIHGWPGASLRGRVSETIDRV